MAIPTDVEMQQQKMKEAHMNIGMQGGHGGLFGANVQMREPNALQKPAPEYLRGLFTGLLAGLGTLRGIYFLDEGIGPMYGGPPSVAVAITKKDGGKVLIEVDTPSGAYIELEKLRAKFAVELS